MNRRTLALAAVAFLVGAALSGALLGAGSLERAMGAVFGTDARVLVRIENVGTHDLQSAVDIRKAGGAVLFEDNWVVPAGGVRTQVLEGRIAGEFLVLARFSWTEGLRRGSGDSTERFSSDDCEPGETILIRFRVDSTNGIAFDGSGVECLAA